jgi:secondary thiamine-phosphate synthase enzyme
MYKLNIKSNKRNELIDITKEVQSLVEKENFLNGLLIIYVPHTTAGITINEGADPNVKFDILKTLEKVIPKTADYLHLEGNSDAHIKASFFGSSLTLFFENKSILLGTWQKIFFFEGDGPRNRIIYIKIINDKLKV